MRRLTLLALISAVMVVLPQTAAMAKATGSIRLTGTTAPVLIGDPFVLAGKFSQGGHRVFVIQRAKSTSSAWHTVKGSKGKTNGHGAYHAIVQATATFVYRAVLTATSTQSKRVSSTLKVQAVTGWRQTAAGGSHTCAIWSDHTLWCWGRNYSGELGNTNNSGVDTANPTPTQVLVNDANPQTWLAVTAGSSHTCAIRTDLTLWCWGDNTYGELGNATNNGSSAPNPSPTQVVLNDGKPQTWVNVAADGGDHTCAVRTDGTLWCWGGNFYGQLGNNAHNGGANPTPSQVTLNDGKPETWVDVTTGASHTCAVRSDLSLWCWGYNYGGQLGNATNTLSNNANATPTKVIVGDGKPETWLGVSAGSAHTCAVRSNWTLYCWGSNINGQLGTTTQVGVNGANPTPEQVLIAGSSLKSWVGLTAGYGSTCGARSDLTVWCWGDNSYGQLGDPSTTTSPENSTPAQVLIAGSGPQTWIGLASSDQATCGIRIDHTEWCWGDNFYGQLGSSLDNGSDVDHASPAQVPSPVPTT